MNIAIERHKARLQKELQDKQILERQGDKYEAMNLPDLIVLKYEFSLGFENQAKQLQRMYALANVDRTYMIDEMRKYMQRVFESRDIDFLNQIKLGDKKP